MEVMSNMVLVYKLLYTKSRHLLIQMSQVIIPRGRDDGLTRALRILWRTKLTPK